MASITSLTGSGSSNSLYGTRNVISGLASGMDTEAMIQNAISGYEAKISGLNQKRTKMEWQQEAYRNIISKMNSFSNKYTSYTSSTNLMSAAFFNNAVTVSSQGKYADKVSASGKSSSQVQVLGVKQLATSSSYAVNGVAGSGSGKIPTIEGQPLDLNQKNEVSNVSGTMTLKYGGNISLTLDFAKDEFFKAEKGMEAGEAFAKAINEKLAKQSITISGNTYTADKKMKAEYNKATGSIEFKDIGTGQEGVRVTSASGKIQETLNIKSVSDLKDAVSSLSLKDVKLVNDDATYGDALKEQEISFTLDGVTKKIKLDKAEKNVDSVVKVLNQELTNAFGAGKITAEKTNDGSLKFTTQQGSTLKIDDGKLLGLDSNSETSYVNTGKKLGEILGEDFWKNTATMVKAEGVVTEIKDAKGNVTYKDEKGNLVKKMDETYYRVDDKGNFLHGFEINGKLAGAFSQESALENVITAINNNADLGVSLSYSKTLNQFKFTASDSGVMGRVQLGEGLAQELFGAKMDFSGDEVREVLGLGENALQGKTFSIELEDGTTVGFKFEGNGATVEQTLGKFERMLKEKMGEDYEASLSEADGSLVITNKGETVDYSYGAKDQVAQKLFEKLRAKSGYVDGQDAIFSMSVDGQEMEELTRSSNSFEVDGLTINLKDTFGYHTEDVVDDQGNVTAKAGTRIQGEEAVSFKTATDSKTIVDAIKAMVEDYNAMAKEIKDAYSTLPMTNSKGNYYEPLTDKDRESMSDSAVEAYEKKAKTGILFGDKDLSGLYNRLLNAVQSMGGELEAFGIGTAYDNGITTLTVNESKLTAALDSDPDKVRDAFTRSYENGASKDGLMQGLKVSLDMYAKVSGTKGVLVEKAGSPLSPTSLYQNTIQKQLDTLEKQISTWQDKMADQVDYYTSKFTQLEKLINEMNAQSSALFGMTSGY